MFEFFNNLDLDQNERKIVFDSDKRNLFVMANCNIESQNEILSRAIGPDEFEMSGMQNIFEVMMPYDINL